MSVRMTEGDYMTFLSRTQKQTQVECNNKVSREDKLHEDILAYCRSKVWIAFHGSMVHRSKRTEGEPDFTILADGGRVFFVECKAKGGKLSEAQRNIHHWSKRLGHTIHTVYSMQDFINAISTTPKQ